MRYNEYPAFLHLSEDGNSTSIEDSGHSTPPPSLALAPRAHIGNFSLLLKASPQTVLDKSFPTQTKVTHSPDPQASFQRAI